jgi:hypothetical protein
MSPGLTPPRICCTSRGADSRAPQGPLYKPSVRRHRRSRGMDTSSACGTSARVKRSISVSIEIAFTSHENRVRPLPGHLQRHARSRRGCRRLAASKSAKSPTGRRCPIWLAETIPPTLAHAEKGGAGYRSEGFLQQLKTLAADLDSRIKRHASKVAAGTGKALDQPCLQRCAGFLPTRADGYSGMERSTFRHYVSSLPAHEITRLGLVHVPPPRTLDRSPSRAVGICTSGYASITEL